MLAVLEGAVKVITEEMASPGITTVEAVAVQVL
jgi:hypothetical protein